MAGDAVTAILKSEDVAGTIEWYRSVGFESVIAPEEGEPMWCEVSRDGVILQFLGGEETPWAGSPAFTGTLYFHPESVDAVFEQVKEHTTPAWGPEDREWGERELGLRDPNGYYLTFTQPAS